MTKERSIGSPPGDLPEVRDITLDEWMDGVRPLRVSVDLVLVHDPDGSAAARLAEIDALIDGMPDGPEVDALIDEAVEVQAKAVARRRFIVEQRSTERIHATTIAAIEDMGLKDVKSADWTLAQEAEVTMRVLLDQIVSPEVTVDQLLELYRHVPDQVDRLVNASTRANEGAEGSRALVRDFYARKSAAPKTP